MPIWKSLPSQRPKLPAPVSQMPGQQAEAQEERPKVPREAAMSLRSVLSSCRRSSPHRAVRRRNPLAPVSKMHTEEGLGKQREQGRILGFDTVEATSTEVL